MLDSVKKLKDEMEKRGLFNKITLSVNILYSVYPVDPKPSVDFVRKLAKDAVLDYAENDDNFCDLLVDAAMDQLFNIILTDDLLKPKEVLSPTGDEQAAMEKAKEAAKMLSELSDILKRF